jgi:CRP-like cAMP-binding protein
LPDAGVRCFSMSVIDLICAQSSASSTNVTFREISAGQFFGEAALLSPKPRAATMVANGPCTLSSLLIASQMFVHDCIAGTLGRLSRERLAAVIGSIVDVLSRDAAVLKRLSKFSNANVFYDCLEQAPVTYLCWQVRA